MFAVCVYVRGSGETVVTANADMQQVVGGSEVDGGRCGWWWVVVLRYRGGCGWSGGV